MYKVEYKEEVKLGIIITTEQPTFKKLIAWIKNHLIGYYPITTCSIKIERVHPSGASEIIADGNGQEVLDLIRVADYGLD